MKYTVNRLNLHDSKTFKWLYDRIKNPETETIIANVAYKKRKETIERLFDTAKEHHGFGYTQMLSTAKMKMKVSLTFACLNLKKTAIILDKRQRYTDLLSLCFNIFLNFRVFILSKEKSRLSLS